MIKQYKKIIKDIMGPDAAEKGFKAGKLEPPGLIKRMLACYEKKYDSAGYYYITVESSGDMLELRSWKLREKRTFDQNDIDSFRQVVCEFAEIMREKGYRLIEEETIKAAVRPKLSMKDHVYFLQNYERLAEEFCLENQVDCCMAFMDKLCLVNEMVKSYRGKKYEDIKQTLFKVAAFYTTVLLEGDKTWANSYLGVEDYLRVYGTYVGETKPLSSILRLWMNEYGDDLIKEDCSLVLQHDIYNSLEWKF